jgi:hypothetical protein
MKEKIVEYGTKHQVIVLNATKQVVTVHAPDINEAFLLIGHGLTVLPQPGDKGKIVFERDSRRGHWQWYPAL